MVKNLKQLIRKFSNEDKCREFLIKQRWNGKPVCPHCGHTKAYSIEHGKRFKCANNECYKKYSVTVGTVFEASNIPLTTWFPAMYIILAHKKGISSVQLGKDLGVTQKTAWFMLHRIRKSLENNHPDLLWGIVEMDETYMARKFATEYKGLSPEEVEKFQDTPNAKKRNKGAVVGIAKRGGEIIVKAFDKNSAEVISQAANQYISKDAILMTDEATVYRKVLSEYNRQTVNHSQREWVRGNIHINNVESFWSVMKRGVYGIYHQISVKHLQQYCNEFSFRYNTKKMKDGDRFSQAMCNLQGRLTYKQLVNGKAEENNSKTH